MSNNKTRRRRAKRAARFVTSGIAAAADATVWEAVFDGSSASAPPLPSPTTLEAFSARTRFDCLRGLYSGVTGAVGSAAVCLVGNLVIERCIKEHGLRYAEIVKKTVFELLQAAINGVVWQPLVSAGTALGGWATGNYDPSSLVPAIAASLVVFSGIAGSTAITNKLFHLKTSLLGAGLAAVGFFLDTPNPLGSAINGRDIPVATGQSTLGNFLGQGLGKGLSALWDKIRGHREKEQDSEQVGLVSADIHNMHSPVSPV